MVERGPFYRDPEKGIARVILTRESLEQLINLPIARPDPMPEPWVLAALHANFVAKGILHLFFGRDWAMRNASVAARSPFLRGRARNQQEFGEHITLVRELAELIYNLQGIPGLDDVLDQIRDRMLGSGFAE